MNLIDNSKWNFPIGLWKAEGNKLAQLDEKGGLTTRAFQLIDSNNFVATYKMRLSRINQQVHGEGKFILSDAESNENFRIDFMHTINICRLTIGEVIGQPFQPSAICELVSGKEYEIKIALKDNFLSVYVDGNTIFENYKLSKSSNKCIGFGSYDAIVEFDEINISAYKEYECFIVMPFDEKRNFLYEYVIKPTLDSHPKFLFKCIRADESLTVGKISEEIASSIKKSDLVIADITSKNPNVFYELGYTHCAKGKALLLIEEVKGELLNIPFDIRDFRCHSYIFSKEGFERITEKLGPVLANMISV
ncbi:MAG TPA: hypothetical protein VHD35_09695 [Chitinophagaceae bacterium]|jgi:hypothetical protein|nr:hypothetical protein [Chitinophagaceae bacterium]